MIEFTGRRMMENTKAHSPAIDSNARLTEYEAGVLTTQCDVFELWVLHAKNLRSLYVTASN
jgi:hypothetical protein